MRLLCRHGGRNEPGDAVSVWVFALRREMALRRVGLPGLMPGRLGFPADVECRSVAESPKKESARDNPWVALAFPFSPSEVCWRGGGLVRLF